jgi:hypothetical protein
MGLCVSRQLEPEDIIMDPVKYQRELDAFKRRMRKLQSSQSVSHSMTKQYYSLRQTKSMYPI